MWGFKGKRKYYKKLYLLTMCLIMVFACGGCGATSDVDQSELTGSDITTNENVDIGETDLAESIGTNENTDAGESNSTNEVTAPGPFGSIQLTVPDTWEAEICDVEDEKLMVTSYGIHLKPVSQSEGYIEVGYSDCFGVCGTGLETKILTVADHIAHIGYYDGNENWNFFSWVEPDCSLRNIIVLCYADWGQDYLDELLDILNSIQYHEENQTGCIGVFKVSSEAGINNGYLKASARNVSSTGATLVLYYSVYDETETDTQRELYFGSYLPIAKKVGEDWVELDYIVDGEVAFDDVAYIIKENEETLFEYNWEHLYGSLEPGEYQIAVKISSESYIYAYFIVR